MGSTGTVLQVITDTDRRGAQIFALDLQDALRESGWDVRTVALAPGSSGGLTVPVLGERRLGVRTLTALRRELAGSSVAVAHGSSTLPACAMATIGTNTPFVYRQISDSRFWANTRARRLRVAASMRRAARVVALWSGAADTIEADFGVHRDRIDVIPNGVSPTRFLDAGTSARESTRHELGLGPNQPTLVYVGALVAEKGVDVAIDAIALWPEAQLLVAGEGPEASNLRSRAELVAPGRVIFAGSIPDPIPAYRAADVVVLPSRGGDSMPAVLIEAGLMGVPVVATAIEGIPEIVVSGVTGSLVSVGSSQELADAARWILEDAQRAAEMGSAARAHCLERFSIQRVAAQWAKTLTVVR